MPDLTELFRSQSGWVVVAVVLIVVGGFVLRPVLLARFGKADDDDADEQQRQGLAGGPTGGPGRTYDAILDALDRLHEVATREHARGNHAEQERDAAIAALERAYRDLDECERASLGPVRDANRYADRRGAAPADPSRRRRRRYLDADADPGTDPTRTDRLA